MKMKIELTADELMNVVDAIMNEAIDRGYDPDEETVDDMLHIVDAAMSAMDIEITEDENEEESYIFDDEEEEENPIEDMIFMLNGKRTISKANANMLLGMVGDIIMDDDRVPDDKKWEVTQEVFLAFAKDHGLECVSMDEDE